jgi:hypothetical protein
MNMATLAGAVTCLVVVIIGVGWLALNSLMEGDDK